MRVSNQMMNQMLTSSITGNQASVYEKQQQVASGKRINKASDDPTAWAKVAGLEQQQNELNGYLKATESASSNLLFLDQSLSSVSDLLQHASELSVKGSGGTLNDVDRDALAEQLDQLLEDLVMVSNSKYNGQYQFGGVDTQTEPFSVTRDVDGAINGVTYDGGSFASTVEVAPGDAVPKQLVGGGASNGILISSTGDAFGTLTSMRDELRAGNNLAESGLQIQMDAISEKVLTDRASVGAFIEHAGFVAEIHSAKDTALATSISGLEDLDIAEAVTELAAKQTAYEAALSMASKTLNTSLMNYL